MTRALSALALAAVCTADAQSYELAWWTVDGGGSNGNASGAFVLDSTSGQRAAGGPFSAAPFVLHSGSWALAAVGGGGAPTADLGITMTDGRTTATPGMRVTYTIVATNAGPSNVTGAHVLDNPPPELTDL